MFFDEPLTLTLLDAFVLGFLNGVEESRIVGANNFDFAYFNSWLTGAIPETLPENLGWRKRIEFVSNGNSEGVQLFFDLTRKFSNGKLNIENQETIPQVLKWSQGTGNMKIEDYQKIEETVVRFQIISHEYSKTQFRIGYNQNDFRVYVEPFIGNEILHTSTFTELARKF